MANWQTDITSSGFNANEQIQNHMGGRERTVDGGGKGTWFLDESQAEQLFEEVAAEDIFDKYGFHEGIFGIGGSGYDIVGIDATQVEPMRDAIRAYVGDVQTFLEKVISDEVENVHAAFRGQQAEDAVKAYLIKVKDYVNNLVSTLLAFSDKLADVGNAWIAAQSNIGSSVNSSAGSFSEGSAYVDDETYKGV